MAEHQSAFQEIQPKMKQQLTLAILLLACHVVACLSMVCGLNLFVWVQTTAEATVYKNGNPYKTKADELAGNTPPKDGVCQKGDASCYDHTNNTGIGPVKTSHTYPPPEKAPYNYAEVLHKSFIFFYQQRSGPMNPQVIWAFGFFRPT